VRVEAPTSEDAERLLDEVLARSRAAADPNAAVAVYYRGTQAAREGVGPRPSSVALVGIPAPTDPLALRLRPRPQYLARVAGVLAGHDFDRGESSAGVSPRLAVEQLDHDAAPIIDVAVTATTADEAMRAYEVAGADLAATVQTLQDRLAVPPSSRYELVPLRLPRNAGLYGDALLSPLYRVLASLVIVLVIAASAVERAVRRAVQAGS
jgi:hypothetical protein